METSYHSYPKIFALGHRAVSTIFDDDVIVEEKVDGSQFSFGKFDGKLRCRSKGKEIDLDVPEKMFMAAVDAVRERFHQLKDGYTYRGEYLQKPTHNALAYDRVPQGHIMIFDINTGHESYLSPSAKASEADIIGFECVPLIWHGKVCSSTELKSYLDRESILGGQKIEGVVVKSLTQFGPDKKAMMGKFVSEAFKEVHKKAWGESNPTGKDIVAQLVLQYRSEMRWEKAIQHLRDDGVLTNSPQDIGKLIQSIKQDVREECEDAIKEALFKWAWPSVERQLIKGFPEFYKERLLGSAFNEE
jgi:hypothetical protein